MTPFRFAPPAVLLAACITDPAYESGKAALSPPICEDRANDALETCNAKCDEDLGAADGVRDQCVADANDDFGLYLQWIVDSAQEADLGSVAAGVQSCWQAIEYSDCAEIRGAVQRYIEESGIPFDAERAAQWNELGCNLDNFTRNWGYVTCVADHAGAIAHELGDGATLAIALDGLPGEALQWVGWWGFCHAQRFGANVAHLGCRNGCPSARENEYAACRGECLGEEGTACVPPGFPAWVDCGVWTKRPAWDALGGSCDCVNDVFATRECAAYDWESGIFGNRQLGNPCRTDESTAGVMTFLVTKDDDGAPSGHEIRCVEVDEYGVPALDLTSTQSSWGDDSCRWANDGVCDEPRYCAYGTDESDCN